DLVNRGRLQRAIRRVDKRAREQRPVDYGNIAHHRPDDMVGDIEFGDAGGTALLEHQARKRGMSNGPVGLRGQGDGNFHDAVMRKRIVRGIAVEEPGFDQR
ncbi:hypothetical protein C1X73_34025, partial [Pseudomonas sp. FW305-130]